MKNTSFFFKFLGSYFVVLLFPLLVMGAFAYRHLITIFENTVIEENLNTAIKTRNFVEAQISSLNQIPVRLASDERFRPFYLENNPPNVIEARKELNDYAVTNDILREVVFYLRGDDTLYSSESTYTLSTFTSYIYRYSSWSANAFYHDINYASATMVRPAERVVTNGRTESSLITIVHPIPGNVTVPYATVILIVDADAIRSMLSGTIRSDRDNTVVLDSNGRIVVSLQDDERITSGELLNTISVSEPYGTEKVELDGVEYLISFAGARLSGWKYVTLVPSDDALASVRSAKTKVLYSTVGLVLGGIIIILIFMHINYSPIGRLRQTAQATYGGIPGKTNEIEAARLAIRHLSQSEKLLSKRLVSNELAVKEYVLLGLLQGNVDSIAEIDQVNEATTIILTKPFFRVIIMSLNSRAAGVVVDTDRVIQMVESCFPPEIQGYGKKSVDGSIITFLLSHDEMSDSLLESFLASIQQEVIRIWGVRSTVGVGDRQPRLEDVGKSFIQASSAVDYKLIKGENTVIFFEEIVENSRSHDYPSNQLELLELSIMQMDADKISATIREILMFVKERQVPLYRAKCLCFDIINTVIKCTHQLSLTLGVVRNEYTDALSLVEFQTVDELATLVMDICSDICKPFLDNDPGSYLLEEITRYVHENFDRRDFSVESTANRFAMTLPRLSRFFKEHTGQRISSYVRSLRVEKAKSLLKTSSMNLTDIVWNVGYSDASSFIKMFKSSVGVTPGEYRKTYEGAEALPAARGETPGS